MKNFNIVLCSFAFATAIIFLSSFAVKNFNSSAFATKCVKYIGPNDDASTPTHPTPAEIRNFTTGSTTDNWIENLTQSDINTVCIDVPYLCGVCFNDTQLTTAQAIEIMATAVDSDANDDFYSVVTQNGQQMTSGGKTIAVYLTPTYNE